MHLLKGKLGLIQFAKTVYGVLLSIELPVLFDDLKN